MASAFVLAAASMTAVSLRSLQFNPNLTTLRANSLQAGNFGNVPSVRRANGRCLRWNISRARLRILRRHSGDFVSPLSISTICLCRNFTFLHRSRNKLNAFKFRFRDRSKQFGRDENRSPRRRSASKHLFRLHHRTLILAF
jgi:hypothetical protein